MGISQKLNTAVKLLKDIVREYAVLTRKNKCIPSGKSGTKKPTKKRENAKNQTRKMSNAKNKTMNMSNANSKKVNFVEPVEPVEPIKAEEPEEQINPFETSVEPEEEVNEVNPMDDGFTKP